MTLLYKENGLGEGEGHIEADRGGAINFFFFSLQKSGRANYF